MKKKICAALALLLCLSLCLILAPGAFAEGEGTYPVRFYNEKNYDLVGLTVTAADGSEIAPAEIGDGYTYLLTPGTYSYVYHDSRGIFLDIEETIFSVGEAGLEIPVTLTASFADEIGFTVGVNPAFIGEVEELTPEEYEQRRQELLDLMVRNLISKSEAEQGFSISDNEVFYAGESSSDQVHAAIKAAMLQHADQTDFLVFSTGEAWNMDQCRQFIKDACSHTGRQREGDTLFYGYSHCGYSWYPDEYDESTGLYRHNLCFTFWYRTTLDQELTTAAKVESIVSELNLSGKSDYEKAYAINQWLYMNVDYDYDRLEDDTYTLKFTDYAALLDEVAVCQGFALSFYRLALEAGLDARYIRSSQMSHAWNIVRLNGVYYELDATWDSNWREGGTPLSQLPHFFARGSSWWLQNHTLNGETYSTIGDQFYSGTEDYDPLFNTYTLSTVDYDPNSVVPVGLAVNETNFPDSIFRAYVSNNFDKDGNGYLSDSEIQAVTTIDVSYSGTVNTEKISSLKGVEHFVDLLFLDCAGNALTELDVSQNTKLGGLICGIMDNDGNVFGNQLSSLSLSNNTQLEYLYCTHNQISSLDVSGNTALAVLYCYNNGMTQLNISGCTSLATLSCGNNQLTSLDVSSNTALANLYCYNNNLRTLTVKNHPSLSFLNCSANPLGKLDVSGCQNLTELYCRGCALNSLKSDGCDSLQKINCSDNELSSLSFSGYSNLSSLGCENNQLVSLDLNGCKDIKQLSCYNNPMTIYDISACPMLVHTVCTGERGTYDNNNDNFDYYVSNYYSLIMFDKDDEFLVQGLLNLPTSMNTVEEEAFAGGSFVYVNVPSSTVSIGPRAFADCPNLRYVFIHDGLNIDPSAFADTVITVNSDTVPQS